MFATLRTTCSRCMPRGSRPRTAVRGARGTPGAHAPCAFAIYSETEGTRRSRAADAAAVAMAPDVEAGRWPRACAAAAHGERAGGSGRCDGVPSRCRVAHLHETQACKSELQRDGEISSGARSGRAGPLKDEG